VYPNPFKENAVIRFNSENSKNAVIKIVDLYGKQILYKNIQVDKSTTEVAIPDLYELFESGCYLLIVNTGADEYIHKIIKL
jgi:hypothetical protein